MAVKTLFVTFVNPAMTSGKLTAHVSSSGDESKPEVIKVDVDLPRGASTDDYRKAAHKKALKIFNDRLDHDFDKRLALWRKRHFKGSISKTSTTIEAPVPPKELVFKPDEIMEFADQMLGRILAIAERPIRLVLQGSGTASTDCKSIVYFNPEPFLNGEIQAGYGRGLHEGSHVRYDRVCKLRKHKPGDQAVGTDLLAKAHKDGGEQLGHILNLVMDRRSDNLQCKEFPGNAKAIRERMGQLMPGERMDEDLGEIVKRRNGTAFECQASVFVDFAYACKKHTRPHSAAVKKCVNIASKAIRRVNSRKRAYSHLLTASKRILEILREHMTEKDYKNAAERQQQEAEFDEFMNNLMKAIYGSKSGENMRKLFAQAIGKRLAKRRKQQLATLPQKMQQLSKRIAQARGGGGIGAGGGAKGNVIKVDPNPAAYASMLIQARPHVNRLSAIIRKLSVPEERVLRGLDRGDFDINALPMLAAGMPDCMKIEFQQRKLDLALALLMDISGSMAHKTDSHVIATAFNEALIPSKRNIDARLFAFHEDVFDCGPPQPGNGIAGLVCDKGTLEYYGVQVAGEFLQKSRKLRKVLITICDGGPAYPKKVKQEVDKLLAMGILPIRILIGVHASPRTYPVELMFNDWNEFHSELDQFFAVVLRVARA